MTTQYSIINAFPRHTCIGLYHKLPIHKPWVNLTIHRHHFVFSNWTSGTNSSQSTINPVHQYPTPSRSRITRIHPNTNRGIARRSVEANQCASNPGPRKQIREREERVKAKIRIAHRRRRRRAAIGSLGALADVAVAVGRSRRRPRARHETRPPDATVPTRS
jgi:hypothetical protein